VGFYVYFMVNTYLFAYGEIDCIYVYIFMFSAVAKSGGENGVRISKVSMLDSSRKFF